MLQWLVLGNEKELAKEKAWAKKGIAAKGLVVHGRNALINAIMQQHISREDDILFKL